MFIGGGNVQQNHLVSPSEAMGQGQLGGITGVAKTGKLHTFDDASSVHVQTGDDALGQHLFRRPSTSSIISRSTHRISEFTKIPQKLESGRT